MDNIYLTQNNVNILLSKSELFNSIQMIYNDNDIDLNKIVESVYPKLKTYNTIEELEEQIISSSTEMIIDHYNYPKIAINILIKRLHNETSNNFIEITKQLKENNFISDDYYNFVKKNKDIINKKIDYERDYNISIFGYRTLEKSYLKRNKKNIIIERPQHLYMRVAIAIHLGNIDKAIETYDLLSLGYMTHATPTLFNAGSNYQQLSSCFLLGIDDNMESIGNCWKDCGVISKYNGGIGINVSNIRVDGALIKTTQSKASGMRLLTVFNQIARYANQGGKRAGAIAIYIEPWHGDIFFFLDLKKNTGAETERARDLFFGLMINDIFMKRVEDDGLWSLMCPSECPDLINKYGHEFTEIYINYEKNNKFLKQIKARDLWFKIMETQIETGTPYILYKDAINYKSNQINIGVINGSNLCAEIVEVSSAEEYSVCNLASICLPKFIKDDNYDYEELYRVSRIITRNLNNIIDINYYPLDKLKNSNLKNRPIGIGVQGLADVFAILKLPFDSIEARKINRNIFETIYYGAISESILLAKETEPYQNYQGSPISKGLFQFDLWNIPKIDLIYDWNKLKLDLFKYGIRNSLVTACMPTATTSQIMGYNECIEPYTENIYTRNTLVGDYYVTNIHLMKELISLNLWNSETIDLIKYYEGSIANIPNIPDNIKEIYRTAWEIPQKSIIEMASERAPFIDQTQSMNIFLSKPTFAKLNSILFYGWNKGLKTGMYYLRTKSSSEANQFGIDLSKIKSICSFLPKHLRKNDCDVCSS